MAIGIQKVLEDESVINVEKIKLNYEKAIAVK